LSVQALRGLAVNRKVLDATGKDGYLFEATGLARIRI
jgi:hypothetical protein